MEAEISHDDVHRQFDLTDVNAELARQEAEKQKKFPHGTDSKFPAMNPDGTQQLTAEELAALPEVNSDELEDDESDGGIEDMTAEAVEDEDDENMN